MEHIYKPEGVCSQKMIIDIEGDIIKSVKIIGGCARKYSWSFKTYRRNEN